VAVAASSNPVVPNDLAASNTPNTQKIPSNFIMSMKELNMQFWLGSSAKEFFHSCSARPVLAAAQ
jgi:hypothetical protein